MMTLLKNPAFYLFSLGTVAATALVTVNIQNYIQAVSTPIPLNSCETEIALALDEFQQMTQQEQQDIHRAMRANPSTLEDDKQGGLSW